MFKPNTNETNEIHRALSLIVQRFKQDNVTIYEELPVTAFNSENTNTNVSYRAYKENGGERKEIAEIQLMVLDATIAIYGNGTGVTNKWFGERTEEEHDAISVKWVKSNEKGYGSLMLGYGVLMMKLKHGNVDYSILDDASDMSIYKTNNIYSKFGYTPLYKATPKYSSDPNEVSLGGPEKQVLISDFLKKVFELYAPENRPTINAPYKFPRNRTNRNRTNRNRNSKRPKI